MRAWFPEREFFMRSDGKVRFVTISSRLQIGAAALIGAAVIGMTGSMGAMAYAQYEASAERAALMTRAAKVADSEERLATYRDDIDTEKFVSASGGPIDPRFERLGISLARMGALELTLDSVPQVMPASVVRISSVFGPRRDPFTGGGAMHSGLDFAGPIGTPIQAAANGRVSFVGVKSGYGKVVEIDHGNGLITRYAASPPWAAPGVRPDRTCISRFA